MCVDEHPTIHPRADVGLRVLILVEDFAPTVDCGHPAPVQGHHGSKEGNLELELSLVQSMT
jgi:hypothetical protein